MRQWYCAKCRMTFHVKQPSANSERCGCPDCRLWFHTGRRGKAERATMTVTPEDLAKHKAMLAKRDQLSYRFYGAIGTRAVEETAA